MLFLFQTAGLFNFRDLQLIAPELIITVAACAALVMEVILPYKLSKWTAYSSLAGIGLAFVSLGAQFLSSGYNLISLYISLELMALTFYVLVAFTKRERRSNEAGMKYFLLGAFSSGILLYGMSVIYGVTGSTNLGEIGRNLNSTGDLR